MRLLDDLLHAIDRAAGRLRLVIQVRDPIPARMSRGGPGNGYDFTEHVRKVLQLAMSEARELNHSYVGTEHLLLGLVREEKGIAAQVLAEFRITIARARDETLRQLGSERTHDGALWLVLGDDLMRVRVPGLGPGRSPTDGA